MAYASFDFDKPAKVADVGVLDQNVEVPDSLQRPVGKPSTAVSLQLVYHLSKIGIKFVLCEKKVLYKYRVLID